MNFREFFTTNTWWGKMIGAYLGYLVAGPAGAFFGILIGNFFDRGLTQHFSKPHWTYHAEKRTAVKDLFLETTFTVMGHLAKSDGHVSESDIQLAKTLMQELNLTGVQIKKAQQYFNEGKRQKMGVATLVSTLHRRCHDNPALLKLFIDIQYRAAQVDGLTHKKQALLNDILQQLGFAPLHQQHRFYEDFATHAYSQEYRSGASGRPRKTNSQYGLDHAFGILEIAPSASKQEVKRAYRRLISRNHPDKLVSKKVPETMIKQATDKTQTIRKAYEQICEAKGW